MTTYSDVCEAKTKKEMLIRFDSLMKEIIEKYGGTREKHLPIQLSNVGYFFGYYDAKVYDRVHKWLKATHPVFGSTYPKIKE